jgi:putative molybdopterin biosynthesis protein
MSSGTHEQRSATTLYSISTVADRLDLSKDTVRRLIERGELTTIRIGSNIRIDAAELEAFLERQRRQPSDVTPGRPR